MLRLLVALMVLGAPVARAAAAPPPVEAYGKLPAVEHISLSPSGERFALIQVVGEARTLVAATVAENVDDRKALVAADVGKAKVVDIDWAGEDHILVTISQTVPLGIDFVLPKAELKSVIVVSLKTGKAFRVFDKLSTLAGPAVGRYGSAEVRGRWYGYFGGITLGSSPSGVFFDHGWPDLYRVDLDTGAATLLAPGGENLDEWLVGPNGAVIARTLYDEKTGDWQVRTGAMRGLLLASGNAKIQSVGAIARGRTPDTIVIHRPVGDGSTFQELRLAGGESAKSPDDDEAEELLVDPVSRLWVGTLSKGDQPTPTFFDPVMEARARGALKAFPGLSTEIVSSTPDLGRMVVKTSGAGDPGTYWLVDIAKHAATPLAADHPDVAPDQVGPIRMVDWKAADGLALRGVLSLPPGREAKNLPVIVMPHGGPEARDYPQFDWWAQLFASSGYAVFQPNFRGSSGYGLDFRDAGFGQMGRKMETDVSDGLAELAKEGIVDPKRACIVGGSYGGYAALAGVTLQHGFYRCAVSLAGLSDLAAFLNYARDKDGAESEAVRYWRKFMGVTSIWESELKPISPAKMAGQADAPILLIHGKDDTVVPIDQSREMEGALKAAGKPVEFVTLPGADHWLLHEDTRLAMAHASLDFVLKYDPPDPEPAAPIRQADAAAPAAAAH